MSWIIPRMWEGADVWILGGGPSVAVQFGIPDKVVQSVRAGTSPMSSFSPYMEKIHDKHVIGINIVFKIGDWMDAIFFGDSAFLLTHKEELSKYPGLKLCCHAQSVTQPWIKFIDKDREHPRGISTRPDQVSWNGNSGACAISIAAWAGAKRIFLLGFDMQLNGDHRQHFHDGYKRGKIVEENRLRSIMGHFDRHLRGFEFIARDAKKMGIEIINVNPDSAVTEFKKVRLQEVL